MTPGQVLTGRFEILRCAGSGGMGMVYQARDVLAGGNVALKLLIGEEASLAARFEQEVQLLSALDHPHIVGYVSHGRTQEGAPYLVMPWLDGCDLQERLKEQPLSVEETLKLAHGVADALAYLHRRGLVHRDLKPTNLFLPQGRLEEVKVIDLGIAHGGLPSCPVTLSGVLLGTPGFIAPEQAYGASTSAPTVDIFAFGCVLFECLTGKRLFSGSHVMAVLAKILLEEAPRVRELRADVPASLERLIDRMVSKEPELRPQDGAELQEWLADLERVVPSEAMRASAPAALTISEQRVVSVLVIVLSPSLESVTPMTDVTRAEVNPLHVYSQRFGVDVYPLAEGVAVAVPSEVLSAVDAATVLARFGVFVGQDYPGAHLALATGSAVSAGLARVPVGEAIDRGVAMVRSAAATGAVQVDDISAALLIGRFEVARQDSIAHLAGERLSLDPTRPLLGQPTSCVGRERELTIVAATFDECLEGGGPKVVLVTGPAGAGKSRVRHEFVRRLAAGDAARPQVIHTQGDPLHVATPYALVAQAVRQMAELHELEDAKAVRERLRAHVAARLPASEVLRVSDFLAELVGVAFENDEHLALRAARHNEVAMADQVRLAFEDILRAACRTRPLVFVMEDLHWCDAMSIKLIDGALRKLVGSKLLVLAVARPEVHERFPLLWSNRHVTEIRLPPLSSMASTKLVHEVMGGKASENDVERIVARSGGNVFYLEELIRAAAERARRRSSLPPPAHREGLPETIIAVAQARLERLDPEVRKVLRAASVFGESFWEEGVAALVGDSPASIRTSLDALIEHEAIERSDRSSLAGMRELSFRHAYVRGAAYATLTEEDRTLGHRLAAAWLDSVDEDREVVGLHWLEGGDRERAARAFADAGEMRLMRAQADAATRCAARSVLVTQTDTDVDTLISRVRILADALETARRIDYEEVMAGLEDHVHLPDDARGPHPTQTLVHVAVDRCVEAVRAASIAQVALAFSRCAVALGALADFAAAKSLLARAGALVADHDPSARSLRYAAAKVAFWEGDWPAVSSNLSTTMLPADTRERVTMLLLLAVSVVSADGREALARGLEYAARAQVLADKLDDDPVAQVSCSKSRLLCFYFAGEHQRAAEAGEEAVDLARQAGLRYEEGLHLHNVGEFWVRVGRLERGRAALLSSNVIAEDLGTEPMRFHNDVILWFLDRKVDSLDQMATACRASDNAWRELHARYWLGRARGDSGDPTGARRDIRRALVLAREHKVRFIADECEMALAALPVDSAGAKDEAEEQG